jgi:hypothetical protein
VVAHDSPKAILAKLRVLESEIQAGIDRLEGMLR